MTTPAVDSLSDRSVLLSLQELTQALPAPNQDHTVRSDEEARLTLVRLLATTDVANVGPHDILPSDAAAISAGRRLLGLMMVDPDTASAAQEVVSDPPDDEQMSLELAITAAVVLAALIGWLQTKVRLRLKRTEGKTDFEFEINKAAANPQLLQTIATTVNGLLGPNPGPPPSGSIGQ
jgi:hypothetical protein